MKMPNGYGSIAKLKGTRRRPWMTRVTVGWTDGGREIRRVIGYYRTRTEALAALADFRRAPYDIDERRTTFADLYDDWTRTAYTDHGAAVPTTYAAAFKRLPHLHGMQFADIRARHMQGEIDACPLGFSTKKMMKTLCNQLFKYAIDRELVTTNYTAGVKLPPAEPSRKHQPFEPEELDALWQRTDDAGAVVALVLSYTGLRPTELCRIRTADVHLDARYMMGGIKTAAGRNRVIPIAEKIVPFIEAWHNPENEYLLISPKDGKPVLTYDRLRTIWETSDALHALGRPHLPHDGRHTCATMLDNAGVNLKTAQLILGHRADDITRRVYTHKTIQQLIDAINCI